MAIGGALALLLEMAWDQYVFTQMTRNTIKLEIDTNKTSEENMTPEALSTTRYMIISETRIPPFNQGKRVRNAVTRSWTTRWRVGSTRTGRPVGRWVSMDTVRFRKGGWRLRRRLLRMLCRDVPVTMSNNQSDFSLTPVQLSFTNSHSLELRRLICMV